MSSNHEKKMKEVRQAEGLTQKAFAELVGLGLGIVKNYEAGHSGIGLKTMDTILNHPRFSKYALWVMTGQVAPTAGQISPPLSPDGQENTSSRQKGQKAG